MSSIRQTLIPSIALLCCCHSSENEQTLTSEDNDCPGLEPLGPPDDSDLPPCDGDPRGTWRLSEVRARNRALETTSEDGRPRACTAEAAVPEGTIEIWLQFLDNGQAFFTMEEDYVSRFSVMSECAFNRCGDIEAHTSGPFDSTIWSFECSDAGCDCDCVVERAASATGEGRWTLGQHGFELYFFPRSLGLCFREDTLTLGFEELVYEFERADVPGTPTPCSRRGDFTCELGTGCRLGGCTGEVAGCGGLPEGACDTYVGCEWAPDLCTGEAPLECTLSDARVVPGCSFE